MTRFLQMVLPAGMSAEDLIIVMSALTAFVSCFAVWSALLYRDPAARRAAAARLRMQLLAEAESILVQDEFPVLPIYFYVNSGLVRKGVSGFSNALVWPDGRRAWNLQGWHPLRGLSVEPVRGGRRPGGQGA